MPGLADLSFFGNLFKNETRSRKKTNLMVFLRPVVVRDANSAERLSLDRYDQMRSGFRDVQPVANPALPIQEAAQLPAPPVRQPAPGGARATP